MFWGVIYPFIDPITREKIHMVSKMEKFLEFIDEDELETVHGGKNDFQYNFEKHWKKEDEEFPIWDPEKEKAEKLREDSEKTEGLQKKEKQKVTKKAKGEGSGGVGQ